MMNTQDISVGNQRLLKLAEHLEKGQLGHKVFDFSTYNNAVESECGTAGCAIGECPVLFPKDWKWNTSGQPRIKGEFSALGSGRRYFSITVNEYCHLFVPRDQVPELFGGKHLEDDATKEQVAANIRAFVAHRLQSQSNEQA